MLQSFSERQNSQTESRENTALQQYMQQFKANSRILGLLAYKQIVIFSFGKRYI